MRGREAEQENRKQEEKSLTHIIINQKQNIMKRFLRFLALVALMCVPWVTQGQQELTVNDGSTTNSKIPVNGLYVDTQGTTSEFVISSETDGMDGLVGATITGLTFYVSDPPASWGTPTIQLYMGEVESTTISSLNGPTADGMTVVATSVWDNTQSTIVIEFDEPYVYQGGNLLIGTYVQTSSSYKTTNFYGVSAESGVSRYNNGSGTGSAQSFLPKVTFTYTPGGGGPTCEKPSAIGVYGITPNTAVVQWDSDVANYILEYKSASESEWTVISGLTSNIYTLGSLLPLTNYSVRVKAVCGTDLESSYRTTSFNTPAGIPLIEAFATTSVPTQWTRYTGLLSDVQGGTALSTTTSGWSFNTGNGVFDNHAKVNIYGTGCKYWLVTPSLTMEDNVQLTFDLALTKYSGTLTPIDATLGADDKFVVLITTDGGTTWEILRQWDNEGSEDVYNDIACTAAGQAVAIDLSSYAGQSIAIAFYGESTVSETGSDNYLHIDNVRIDYIPSCAIPTGLAYSDVTAHSVTLNWNSEGADSWQLSVNDATEMTGGVLNSSESTFTLMGLTPETQYRVKVRSVCGGYYSEWTNNVTFTTAIACPAPTSFATSNVDGHSAVLTWTENGSATEWEFTYKASDEEDAVFDDNVVTVTGEPTYSLTGLVPQTTYNLKVRAVCGGIDGESQWATRTLTTTVACPAPSAVTVTNITTTTAVVNCTSNAENFSIMLGEEVVAENVTLPYTLTGLDANTSYTVKLMAFCGGEDGESEWTSGTPFMTAEICPDGMACIGAGTSTSNYLPVNNYYNYSLTEQIYTAEEIGMAGAILSIDFYKAATIATEKDLDIYIVATDKDEFESTTDWITVTAADLVYSGTVNFVDNDWTTIELDNPFIYDGESNIAIVVDNNTGDYESNTAFRVFTDTKNRALYYQNDNTNADPQNPTVTAYRTTQKNRIRLAIGEPPACAKPTGLAVNYEGGNTAEVTWTGEADSYNINVNGDVTEGVTSPYTLEELDLATTYEVMVQAVCGNTESDWTSAVSFTTDLCETSEMCNVTMVLTDAWGDGWNGAAIQVTDVETNTLIGELANENLNGTTGSGENEENIKTLAVCNGRQIQFTWKSGNYDSEASYTVTDINDEEIFSGSGAMTEPVSYEVNCTVTNCKTPSDLAVSEIGSNSAQLSWTENGEAEAWVVAYKTGDEDFEEVDADANPYVLEGLTPATEYIVKVRPVCDDEAIKWSDVETFTTDVACPAPTELTATELTAESALLGWTGTGDNYNVRYRHASGIEQDFESGLNDWTSIDADGDGYGWVLGSETGGVYLAEGSTLYGSDHSGEGDMATSGSYSNVYGTLEPDNYLVSPLVNLGGSISFWAVAQDANYPEEHFGVAVSTTGNTDASDFTTIQEWTMGATGATPGAKDQSTWVEITVDLSAYAGQTGYVAIRHFNCTDMFFLNIDDITIVEPSNEEWTVAEAADNEILVEGLDPENKYEFQVQSVCGDVTSQWASATFTTLPNCMYVADLAQTDATSTTATIAWTDEEASAWEVSLYLNDELVDGYPVDANEQTYTFEGLEANTQYKAVVRANCGDAYSPERYVMISTDCAPIATLPYEEGFEEGADCWKLDGFGRLNNSTYAHEGSVFIYADGGTPGEYYAILPSMEEEISGLALNFYYYNLNTNLDAGILYVGYVTNAYDYSTFEEVGSITMNPSIGEYAQSELYAFTDAPEGSRMALKYVGSGVQNTYVIIDDINVDVRPSCMLPTGLTYVYEGGASTPVVSWISDADSWNIDINDQVIEGVENPYEIEDVAFATTYTIKVQAVCGEETSEWTEPISFTTDMCDVEDQCEITFVLTDAWGDGWNGAAIQVTDVETGNVLGELANENLNGTSGSGENEENIKTLAVCDGRQIQFTWISGSYDSEASYSVTDALEQEIFSGSGAMSEPVDFVNHCTPPECVMPTDLAVSDVTAHTATINFTFEADGAEYRLNGDDETIVGIQELPLTIEGLDGATDYSIQVRAICGTNNTSDWTSAVDFTTLESCPAVTDVEVELVSTTSVNVTWNDENGAASYYIMMGDEMLGEETEPAVIINEQTATITGLTAETNYAAGAFQVFANCGELDGVSAGADVPAFFTGYCVPNPTSRDGKGITSVVFGSGDEVVNNVDETNGLPAAAPFYGNYSDMIGAMPAGVESTIAITYATGSSTVYSYGTIIWVDWNNNMTFEDDEIVYTGTSAQGSGGTPQVLEASFVVPATQELGDYRMRIAGADSYFDNYINGNATSNHSACFTSTYSVCHDYTLRVTEAPSCLPAADVTVSNIGTTTADLTWVNNNGADATYTVKNGDEVLTTEAVDGYQLTGLTPAHNYAAGTFTVVANCDETAVVNVPAFVTACDVIAAEGYAENFDGYTVASAYTAPSARVLPACWNAINTTTSSTYAVFPTVYYYSSTNYANSTPNSLKFYSYYSSYTNYDPQDQYAILPEMEGLAGKQITLQARGYNTSSTFKVGLMTDPADASTFVAIATQEGLTTSYQEFEYIIPTDAEGSYVAIMIEAANSSRTTNGAYIDDITIDNPPACIKPTYLAATLIPAVGDKAILNWTENGDATAWEICLNGDEDNLIEVTENPYTLTDLTAEEIYTAKVRANCGDNGTSDWSNEVTFNPTNKIVIGEGTTTSSYLPTQTNFNYSLTNQIYTVEELGEAGAIFSVDFFMTGNNYTRNLNVYMVSTDKTGFENNTDWIGVTEDDLVFSGDVEFVGNEWTTITFANPFVYDGINNVAIIVDDNTGVYSSRSFRVFTAGATQSIYQYNDNTNLDPTADPIGNANGTTTSKNQIRILKGEPPTCYKPTAVEATEITAEGATITWTRDERNAEGETYSILDENHEPVAEAEELTGDNFQLTGLEAAHEYTYYVLTNCANDEEVNLVAVTFTTLADCPAPTEVAVVENSVNAYNATISWTGYPANENGYLVSYRTAAYFDGVSEQFATTSAPTGWTRYTGLLSDVMNGTQLTTTTSGWTFGTGNNVFDNHAKINIYGTGSKYWLVTPDIDVTEGYVLNFDMALTVWSSSSSASPTAGSQPDDKFVVLVSGDEMATWTILRQWDNEGSEYVYDDIPNTGENVSIDLSDFVGQTVNIAFYGESTTSNGDNNLHIDNVAVGFDVAAGDWETVNTVAEETTVELTNLEPETLYEVKVQGLCADDVVSEESESITFTTLPSCVPVTDVQVNNITSNSVDVSWTAGLITDNAWQIAYRENGASDWTEAAVYDNPFPLTDLTANTAYELRVRTFCSADEQSDWSNTVSFTTECDAIAIPYTMGFESDDDTWNCWSMVDVAGSTGINNNSFKFAYNYNPPQYLISPALTGTENGVQVEFDYKAGGNYAESFMVGYSTTTSEPDAFTWGEELTGITSTTYQRYYEIIPEAGVKYICIKYTANDMLALYIDNFEVKEIVEFNVNVAVSTASGEPLGTVTSEPTDLTGLHYNDEVTLTAATDVTGYEFKGWYNNDDEGAFITDENPYTFNVTSDRYILAAFGLMQYTVSVSADDNGTAYIIDPETSEPVTSVTADYNSELTLVAEANTCYEFVNWTLNGDPVSTDASYTINVLDNNAYVANFTEKSYTGEETVTACDSYEWNGTVYEESTIVDVTLESVEGCDSVATLNLTINNSSEGVEITTVCDSYEWIDGETYTESTNEAQFTLEGGNAHGCDSLVTLNLTVNYSSTGIDEQVACDSYEWMDGETYTESTNEAQFTLEGANAYGCDSLVTLHLTVNNSTTGIDEQTACDSYTWIDGIEYTASNNEATFTLENAAGCDSVVTLNLTVNYSTTGIDEQIACDSYEWIDGNTYTESNNTATFTTTTVAGCDSVVTLNLTVNYSNSEEVVETITENQLPYTFMNIVFEAGVVNEPIAAGTNVNGCDSTVYFTLIVNMNGQTNDFRTICDNELPYTWNGVEFTEAGMQSVTLEDIYGADSVVNMYLTVNYGTHTTETVVACNEYIWRGETYTESDTYVYEYTNVDGCASDSTLNLTINTPVHEAYTAEACDVYVWNNNEYIVSDDYTYAHEDVNGCTQVDTLHLTIKNSTIGVDVQTACDSYTWIDGIEYTASNNEATFTMENAAGCDSVITLNLTINNSNTGVDVQTACDSYTWINGETYTASNNEATFTLTNAAGCDSVVTLNLTVNYSNTGIDEHTACDTYTWIDGIEYTASNNEATFTLENANAAGCDSVVTLNLTINNSNTGVDVQTACDSYTWINGETYTASNNEATFTLENAAGCDSVVTLNLTINNSNTGVDVQTACDSYTWIDGIEYTASNNEATFTLTNAAGCDSVVTLNLTINNSVNETLDITAMDSYTFNGIVFTEDTTYVYTGTTVNGCDSIVTLHLTITHNTDIVVILTVNDATMGTTNPVAGTYVFSAGDVVTATATANEGYEFVGWVASMGIYSDTVSREATVTYELLPMMQGMTINVEAVFQAAQVPPTTYTVTVNYDTNMGTVTSVPETLTGLAAGTEVTLTATALEGYEFTNWTDATGTALNATNPYTFTVTENVTINANFQAVVVPPTYYTVNISVNPAEAGIVNGMPDTNAVVAGTELHLTAVPANNGYVFVNWTVNDTTVEGATLDTVVNADMTIVANFENSIVPPTYYTVTVNYDATMGTVEGIPTTQTVAEGTQLTLTATALEGYEFVNWTVNGQTVEGATYTTTVNADLTIIANFQAVVVPPTYYTVTVNYDETMGTVEGIPTEAVEAGSNVTLTATAKTNYRFVGWLIGEDTVSHEATYTIEDIQSDVTISAVFVSTIGINDVDMSNVSIYSANSTIYVKGAEGQTIHIYDLNGRTVVTKTNAAETMAIPMDETGVYLVRVGNAAAKRVMLMR